MTLASVRDISADISLLQKAIKKALVNRLSIVIQAKVKEVTEDEEKLTLWMRKQKTYELSDGDSFSLLRVGKGSKSRH